MSNLIAISGKMGSGKDELGMMMQYQTDMYAQGDGMSYEDWRADMLNRQQFDSLNQSHSSPFEIKKFAEKLKMFICELLGCSREMLENRQFKNSILGPEWWFYMIPVQNGHLGQAITMVPYIGNESKYDESLLTRYTPRLLLQIAGTEAGRQIIHPNVWVNALFADYKIQNSNWPLNEDWTLFGNDYQDENGQPVAKTDENSKMVYPSWIITDMRFHNEVEAVKSRNGIVVRVEREGLPVVENPHESETALDDYSGWNYTVGNNGSLDELMRLAKFILTDTKSL